MRSTEPHLRDPAPSGVVLVGAASDAGGTNACRTGSGRPSRNWPRATHDRSRGLQRADVQQALDLEDEGLARPRRWAPGAGGTLSTPGECRAVLGDQPVGARRGADRAARRRTAPSRSRSSAPKAASGS